MAEQVLYTSGKIQKLLEDPELITAAEQLGESVESLVWETMAEDYPQLVLDAQTGQMGLEEVGKEFDGIARSRAKKSLQASFEPKPQDASFFEGAISRGLAAGQRALPGGATVQALQTGEGLGGAVAKDVAQGALVLGLGGVRAGSKALGVGAAVDSILEGSGINKASKEGAEAATKLSDDISQSTANVIKDLTKFGVGAIDPETGQPMTTEGVDPFNLPSKVGGIEGMGTVLNAMSRIPGFAAGTVIEAIPALIAGFLGGKVGAVKKGQQAGLAKETEVPARLEGAALVKRVEEVTKGGEQLAKTAIKRGDPLTGRVGAEPLRGEKALTRTIAPIGKAAGVQEGAAVARGTKAFEQRLAEDLPKGKQKLIGKTPTQVKAKELGIFAEKKLVDDVLKEFPGAEITRKGKKGVPQFQFLGDDVAEKSLNQILRAQRVAGGNPQQLFNQRKSLDNAIDKVARSSKKAAKVIRDSINNSIEKGLRFGSDEAADSFIKFKKKVSDFKTIEAAVEKSLVQGGKQRLDGNKAKAIFIDDRETADALERTLGKARVKKMLDLFIASKADEGAVLKAVKLTKNLTELGFGIINRRGRAFNEILKDAFAEPNFKLPKSELNFIKNLDAAAQRKTKVDKILGALTPKKTVNATKLLDETLAAVQQRKSEE